jgi:hypothetical protein
VSPDQTGLGGDDGHVSRLNRRRLAQPGRAAATGSGNIQIEPDDRHLCIGPASSRRPRVILPSDGDQVLSVILSKALLLAADDKITGPAVLQQLKQRR